uniref:Regeneration-upregulated protein 3 n=1 Tax=Enchytraeus japonensis TaxID=228735 RepID=Q1MXG3_9ANNE|nr:regeneration-upregulated protein 3 [Enchytraeus japonensis]
MSRVVVVCLALILSFSFSVAGVSYIRWGRSSCPPGNNLLYTGYMAGPKVDVGGSGSNFLCMHKDPKFVNPIPGLQSTSGHLVGVEFDIYSQFNGLFKTDNVPDGNLLNKDMLCAVCQVAYASDQLMIPGRPDCNGTGYQFQYKGFLVSEDSLPRGRSQYVCLDEAPEGRVGGNANDNQCVVLPVQVGCGSLPCDPYVHGYEVPCAICTN